MKQARFYSVTKAQPFITSQDFVCQKSKVSFIVVPVFREGIPLTCWIPFSYNVGAEDLFELFGKFGPIRCVSSASLTFTYIA